MDVQAGQVVNSTTQISISDAASSADGSVKMYQSGELLPMIKEAATKEAS